MNSQSFPYAKGKLWQRWLYGGCLATFFALAATRFIVFGQFSVGTWLSVFLLALGGAFAFRGLVDRRPVLTIGPEGIWFARWGIKRPIHWGQVREVKLQEIGKGGPLVCIHLNNEEEGRIGHLPQHFFGTALLDISAPDAYAIAIQHLTTSKANEAEKAQAGA